MDAMALLMRPGYTLLLAGLLSFLVSRFIGVVPLVGGILTGMLALFGMFAIVGVGTSHWTMNMAKKMWNSLSTCPVVSWHLGSTWGYL